METNKRFNQTLLIVFGVACFFIAILAYFVLVSGPRIRRADFDIEPQNAQFTKNSVLSLRFDRPISQSYYTEGVYIEPYVGTVVTTSSQEMSVRFTENLKHNTTYTLRVLPRTVSDTTGRLMKGEYTYTFTTGSAKFMYLERNYGADSQTGLDADDRIIEYEINGQERVVYSAPVIRSFSANADYVFVVEPDEVADLIHVIDRITGEITKISPFLSGYVSRIQLPIRGSTGVYIRRLEATRVSQEFFAAYNNRLVSVDARTRESLTLTDGSDGLMRGTELVMSRDGQYVLARDQAANYSVLSPYNDYEPILLGEFRQLLGVSGDGGSIYFNTNDGVIVFNVIKAELSPVTIPVDGLLHRIDVATDTSFVSMLQYDALEPTKAKIFARESLDTMGEQIWEEAEGKILRDMSVSYDASLIALQRDPLGCSFDNIITNAECEATTTQIYDRATQKVIAEVAGFDLVWLP